MNAPQHSSREHAFLSPSASHRWLHCTAAPTYEDTFQDTPSAYAEEGTKAHEVAELLLRGQREEAEAIATDIDMLEYGIGYADYVNRITHGDDWERSGMCMIETRVSLAPYEDILFGTADALVLRGDMLHVIDYKYGQGVKVSAVENTQLKIYALAAISTLNSWNMWTGDITDVVLHIYQPRVDNISTWHTCLDDLNAWRIDTLNPTVELIKSEITTFKAGSHCQFCKGLHACKAYKSQVFDTANGMSSKDPDKLNDEEYKEVLDIASDLRAWLTAVEEYILNRTLGGEPVKGYKAVEGRSVRKYADETAIITALAEHGYSENEYMERKLAGITKLEKTLGKKQFQDLLGGYIIKPEGKPTLVPESDKRKSLREKEIDLFEEIKAER